MLPLNCIAITVNSYTLAHEVPTPGSQPFTNLFIGKDEWGKRLIAL